MALPSNYTFLGAYYYVVFLFCVEILNFNSHFWVCSVTEERQDTNVLNMYLASYPDMAGF